MTPAQSARHFGTLFTTRFYLRGLDLFKGIPYPLAAETARGNERLGPESLRQLAFQWLRDAVDHAYWSCPYYQRSFDAARVRPGNLRAPHDLRAFPIVSKGDVFEHREEMCDRSFTGPIFKCTTSGSTGMATSFYIDGTHAAWVDASVARGRRWWGVQRGELELVLWARSVDDSPTKDLRAWLKYRLRNRVQFDTFVDFDDERANAVLAAIRRVRPRVLYGYGSSLGRLAVYMAEMGERLAPDERPVFVEYTADHMSAQEQTAAEDVFGSPVLSAYGSSEVGGVAQQCQQGRLHVSIDHAWVEFVRPDGSPAASGEQGEIVLTTLHNRYMPLVRFRVGDVGAWSPRPCSCGSPLPCMELSLGKAVDLIETPFVRGVSAHVLDYANLHLMRIGVRGIRQFFVEQDALDHFVLLIVQDRVFDPHCAEIFVQKMQEKLGPVRVDLRFVDEVPRRSSGKRAYFRRSF